MRPSRTSSMSSYSMVDAVPFNDPKWPQMWYLVCIFNIYRDIMFFYVS